MSFCLDHAMAVLKRTPQTLSALLYGLPETWLDTSEGEETWSPFDVLGHLIHGEETDWIPRARIILEHGENKAFEPFDRFAQFRRFRGCRLGDMLDTFAALRADNLSTLAEMHLTPEQLLLTGYHPELGTVTLGQLIATWTVHDLGHIRQIVRTMAFQYRDAVGPWKAYLSILERST